MSRAFTDALLLLALFSSLTAARAFLIIRPKQSPIPSHARTRKKTSPRHVTKWNTKQNDNSAENDALYQQFLDHRKKKEMIHNCPVFSKLTPDDMDRVIEKLEKVIVPEDTKLISQGEEGDKMYFVVDGEFEFRLDGKTLDQKCSKGQFFGELAVFFRKARAVDVVSTKLSSVWVLSRTDFLSAAQESSIDKDALELLRKSYKKKKSPLGGLLQLKPRDIWDLYVLKSRPKKKAVSMHGTMCMFALGVFVTSLLPLFLPGFDANGIPRIWNVGGYNSPTTLRQMQIASWLITITGASGLPRIPRRAPQCRRLLFQSSVAYSLFISLYVSSNLTGTTMGLFNAFAFPWNLLIFVSGLYGGWFGTLPLLDDSIAGPMNGRYTLPIAGTRISSILTSLMIQITSIFFVPLIMPVAVSDLASYNTHVASFVQNGAEGSQLSLFVLVQATMWIASFFSTLLFEKKIKPSTANKLCGTVLFLLLFDPIIFALVGLFSPSSIVGGKEMLTYFSMIVKKCAINRVAFGLIFLTIINATRKVILGQKQNVVNKAKKIVT